MRRRSTRIGGRGASTPALPRRGQAAAGKRSGTIVCGRDFWPHPSVRIPPACERVAESRRGSWTLSSQQIGQRGFCLTHSLRQIQPREVERQEAGNIIALGPGGLLLGLHYLYGIGDTEAEPVARFAQSFGRI